MRWKYSSGHPPIHPPSHQPVLAWTLRTMEVWSLLIGPAALLAWSLLVGLVAVGLWHAANESSASALIPSTKGLRGHLIDGTSCVLQSLKIKAHIRCLLRAHWPTLSALALGPPAALLIGCSSGTASCCFGCMWLILSVVKIYLWVTPHPFPRHITNLLLDQAPPMACDNEPRAPNDLTEEELGLLRFVRSISSDLDRHDMTAWERTWSMRGGAAAQEQLGFTSIRCEFDQTPPTWQWCTGAFARLMFAQDRMPVCTQTTSRSPAMPRVRPTLERRRTRARWPLSSIA